MTDDIIRRLLNHTERFVFQGGSQFAVELANDLLTLRKERDAMAAELANLQIVFNDWKVMHSTTQLEVEVARLKGVARKAREAIQAMQTEFRALDLPYGSQAYNQANDVNHELRNILGDLI